MAAEPANQGLREVLSDLVALLAEADERVRSARFSSILDEVTAAHGDRDREQQAIRLILSLYQGGMGSFQDLVLQDANGVPPEQDQFARLRHQLFEQALAAL